MKNKQVFFTCSEELIKKIDDYHKEYFDDSRYSKSNFMEDMLKIGLRTFEIKLEQVAKEQKDKETN